MLSLVVALIIVHNIMVLINFLLKHLFFRFTCYALFLLGYPSARGKFRSASRETNKFSATRKVGMSLRLTALRIRSAKLVLRIRYAKLVLRIRSAKLMFRIRSAKLRALKPSQDHH